MFPSEAEHHWDWLLKPREIPKGWPAPSVMLEDVHRGILSVGSLKDEVWRFFPRVSADQAETYQYPLPLGERFWTEYAEPVADFVLGAAEFARAVRNLNARRKATQLEGLRTLHAMTGAVRVALEPGPKRTYRQVWRSPSLLASFALMLLQDLAEQAPLYQCAVCNTLFTSKSRRAKYCSPKCRNTANKRIQRNKEKSKRTSNS